MPSEDVGYILPPPTLHEHYYLQAIVLELQRIRAALELSAQASQGQAVELREPGSPKGPKPKRGDPEPLSMVEPVPQEDVTSLVEVEPEDAQEPPTPPLSAASPRKAGQAGATMPKVPKRG